MTLVNGHGRPLEGPARAARLAPFIAVATIGALSLAVPPWPRGESLLVVGIATTVAVGVCAAVLPWSRWPAEAQAIPPLMFYLGLVLMRAADGGSTSGLAPLAVLPVLWLALYGSRGELMAAVTACGAQFLVPLFLIGGQLFPIDDWRRGTLWTIVSAMAGTSIQRLVGSAERRASSLDTLLDLSRRMGTASPLTARTEACRTAGEISGAQLSLLMEPDGVGNLESTATNDHGRDLLPIVLPLTEQPAGSVTAFNTGRRLFVPDAVHSTLVSQELIAATGVASVLFEPIQRDGKVIGVLVLGFSTVRARLDPADTAIIVLITHQLAAMTVRVDLLAKLEALVADASDLVGRYVLIDQTARFTYASASSYALLGRQPETLIGTSPMDLIHPDDRAMLEPTFVGIFSGQSVVTVAYRVAHADGRWIWVESSVRPIIDLFTGRVTEVQSTTRDISGRQRMEMELRRTTDLLAGVLRAATDSSIIATDVDGIITVFNGGAERLLGYSAAEMIGRAFSAALHDPLEVADRARELGIEPGFEAFVRPVRQGGDDRREWTCITKDRRRIHVLLTMTAVRDAVGLLTGFVGIARDLSERDSAMSQLHAASERQKSMVTQLNDLVIACDDLDSVTTHDLGTPLSGIRGRAQILVDGAKEPNPAGY